jgi:subtilisin
MATKKNTRRPAVSARTASTANVSATTDELLLAALAESGVSDSLTTGRYIVTFKEGAMDAGIKSMKGGNGFRMASAADFSSAAGMLEAAGDADAFVFPEIGVALIGAQAAVSRGMSFDEGSVAEDSAILSIDPEYFAFASGVNPRDYLKGVLRTAQMISQDLGLQLDQDPGSGEFEVTPAVSGQTWGLSACGVGIFTGNGSNIKVAVLDTGMDLGHPDFAGRPMVSATFNGQPVQDLHSHGTHCIGTASGSKAPAGTIPRYGVATASRIFVGKVLSNSGSGTQAQILAGMNWAVQNRCEVISMSLGSNSGVQPSYTNAGQAALNNGCLIVAATGNSSNRPSTIAPTGAPANSPTIMAVAAVDSNLRVAPFSSGGKVDIAGPGVNVFSSVPRPQLHGTKSGTSMATPHVAGCAATWAASSASLRGTALWAKLTATAKRLPAPTSDVGAGLVQAYWRRPIPIDPIPPFRPFES